MVFMRWLFFVNCLLFLMLTACGGGGGAGALTGPASSASLSTGQFIDSSVQGVTYTLTTPDGQTITGVTDALGTFQYVEDEKVVFSIGDIVFPATTGDTTVSPLTMALGNTDSVATNVAFLLQSLDYDQDPSNGITIDPRVAQLKAMAVFATNKIDWTQDPATFANNAKLKALITQAKVLNPDNSDPSLPAKPPITPDSANQHLTETLFSSLDNPVVRPTAALMSALAAPVARTTGTLMLASDTPTVQPQGCADSNGLYKPSLTILSPNLWADLMAKPKTPVYPGWIFDGDITQANALNAPGGDMRIYKPTEGSPEVLAAMQSDDWLSLDSDIWLQHQTNPNVILRIAGKQRLGGESVYYPKLTGSAIYLHYTGAADTALEFQFANGKESTAFFGFVGNNADTYYRGTMGKDGVIGQGGDDGWNGWTQDRGDDWFRHQPAKNGKPADANFPPNLHKGGTTPLGRTLGAVLCTLKSGGSVLLWRKPNNNSDLFFSPVAQRNSVGILAPIYTDATGYQGNAGIRTGIKVLQILKATDPPVVPIFNPADAFKRTALSGYTKSLVISGDCKGLASFTWSALKDDVIASVPTAVFSLTETMVATSSNCPDFVGTDKDTMYLNANYQQIAAIGGDWIEKHSPPKSYPTSVKVGDRGTWSSWVETSLDFKTVLLNGSATYSVEADGTSTNSVILAITIKAYKPNKKLSESRLMRYRIKPASAAELLSIDLLTPSGKHVIAK